MRRERQILELCVDYFGVYVYMIFRGLEVSTIQENHHYPILCSLLNVIRANGRCYSSTRVPKAKFHRMFFSTGRQKKKTMFVRTLFAVRAHLYSVRSTLCRDRREKAQCGSDADV